MVKLEGKAEAVMRWLRGWDGLDGRMKLAAVENRSGDAGFLPGYALATLAEYIDGRCRYEYVFDVSAVLPWSSGADGSNAEAVGLMESFIDWVNGQGERGSFPDWPGAEIHEVGSVYAAPTVQVTQDQRRAKYMFQARIVFTE